MKTAKMLTILVLALGMMVCLTKVTRAAPMGTAITYQGRLIDANEPADELYDFRFKLYDAESDGNKVGDDVNIPNVDVIEGYFMVELDFGGGVFTGDTRWLEIGVRPGDSNDPNDFVTLSPRQEVTPVPYSLQTRGIYVDPNGNVGIGTTSPIEKLHVNGNLKVRNIELGQGDITDRDSVRIIIDRDNDQTDQTFSVWRDGTVSPPGTELFRIQENGNVGMGTTNPEANLEIYDVSYSKVKIHSNTSNAILDLDSGNQYRALIQLMESGNTRWGIGNNGDANDKLIVSGDGGVLDAKFVIAQNGSVGIGTQSPSERLHVVGRIRIVDGNEGANRVLTSDANGVASWQNSPTGALPRGVIVMWWGLTSNVPSGWALCDGGNYIAPDGASVQTPDLRDRFIVGARQDDGGVARTNVKGSLMQTGGDHEHMLIEAEMPAHRHTGRFSDQGEDSDGDDTQYDVNKGATSVSGSTGGNQAHENCPPFYALAFIMHL